MSGGAPHQALLNRCAFLLCYNKWTLPQKEVLIKRDGGVFKSRGLGCAEREAQSEKHILRSQIFTSLRVKTSMLACA